jgi:hypothetical protein
MWIAYDRMSPIGDWRGDVQAAQISAAAFNAQGGKVNLPDLVLNGAARRKARKKRLSLKNGCLISDARRARAFLWVKYGYAARTDH